jgi:hypothetical protein
LIFLDREVRERAVDLPRADVPQSMFVGHGERIALQRAVAVAQRPLRRLGQLGRRLRRAVPAVRIDAHRIAHLSAEQLVDRCAEHLALDVPQCLLDRADRGEHDRAAALGPERVVVHLRPERFDARRIAARIRRSAKVLDHSGSGGAAEPVGDRRFADAGGAVVRHQLDDDRMELTRRDEVDVDGIDLHARSGSVIGFGRPARAARIERPASEPPKAREL